MRNQNMVRVKKIKLTPPRKLPPVEKKFIETLEEKHETKMYAIVTDNILPALERAIIADSCRTKDGPSLLETLDQLEPHFKAVECCFSREQLVNFALKPEIFDLIKECLAIE